MSNEKKTTDETKEHEHRLVLDTFPQLTGVPRTVPGDCYCTICSKAVPYWLNGGKIVEAA